MAYKNVSKLKNFTVSGIRFTVSGGIVNNFYVSQKILIDW